jgi:hypothetical protein
MQTGMSRRQALGTAAGLAAMSLSQVAALIADEPADAAPSARPLAQDYTVVYHNREHKLYVEGCGLLRLADGVLLAIVPIVPRSEWTEKMRPRHSHLHVMRSEDHGRTWREVSELPYYSGRPWSHDGKLYLFAFTPGPKQRNDDLLLLHSEDGGGTWSKPVTLFQGHYWNCCTNLVVRDAKLYWAVDDLTYGNGDKRTTRAICGDLSSDPLNPAAWRMSDPVPFPGVPRQLSDPKRDHLGDRFLEPNVIEVAGRLRVISSVKLNSQTTTNLAAIYDLEDRDGKLELTFLQYHPMLGGHLDFSIVRDEVSQMFWACANLAVDSRESLDFWRQARSSGKFRPTSTAGDDRRMLMLLYGLDGINWFQAGCIAQAPKLSQSFMYAVPVVDGDDLAVVSRSSVNAPHQHDADYCTFHRVKNFRRLALNLIPQAEE